MRTTLTIEIKFDTALTDDERRKTFIDLAIANARTMYGQAAMLAERTPTVTVTTVGREGFVNYPLFSGDTNGEKS